MYEYFLSLGSNLGDKINNIDLAINKLQEFNCEIIKIAPFYQTEPIVPENADESYYKLFYNTVIKIVTDVEPLKLLKICKQIEKDIGRPEKYERWSPRLIDIDILFCKKDDSSFTLNTDELTIPHKEIFNRAFVLDPLAQIAPDLIIEGRNVLEESKKNLNHQSAKMLIVNINNNSFSGDGILDRTEVEKKIKYLIKNRVAYVDVGAESTNPKAKPIQWQEEVDRLWKADIFNIISNNRANGVKFSIDTYHPETAELAIRSGFDIINDVNGFKDERMWGIMHKYQSAEAIIMHSLTPHGNKENVISNRENIIDILNQWVKEIEKISFDKKISKNRIIIDYGIGFGKTPEHDLFIINNLNKINNLGFRVLIGHSRKSFLKLLNANTIEERDIATKKISMQLTKDGVDILRIHAL